MLFPLQSKSALLEARIVARSPPAVRLVPVSAVWRLQLALMARGLWRAIATAVRVYLKYARSKNSKFAPLEARIVARSPPVDRLVLRSVPCRGLVVKHWRSKHAMVKHSMFTKSRKAHSLKSIKIRRVAMHLVKVNWKTLRFWKLLGFGVLSNVNAYQVNESLADIISVTTHHRLRALLLRPL